MNKQILWTTEIIIWLLIIAGTAFWIHCHFMHNRFGTTKMQIVFEDTDGLIVGSNVRFMGVIVGYVSDIKIQKDKTLVTFVITKKGIKIPKHSVASVEFSGLAASKSLELYAPEDDTTSTDALVSTEPYKIKNYMENQKNIANNIIDMSNNFNDVLKKNNINRIKSILRSKEIFTKTNKALDDINELEDKAIEELRRVGKDKNNENQ